VHSPVPEQRKARSEKKRASLGFFGKIPTDGTATPVKEKEDKAPKPFANKPLDAVSSAASSRSHSKDATENRLSFSFATHVSPTPEALPPFPSQTPSQLSLTRTQSHRQSFDSRPPTGKSMKSDKSVPTQTQSMGSSMMKRLSFMSIGKKKSKNSFKGRGFDDTLAEE
jgi:dedicator of cytokinesis protein 3